MADKQENRPGPQRRGGQEREIEPEEKRKNREKKQGDQPDVKRNQPREDR